MDGASMAIEALGAIITKKDEEIKKHLEKIDKLNKKIDAFRQYFDVYEEYFRRTNDGYKDSSSDLSK